MAMTAIVIVGAGYAGLLAANRAAARGLTVTLVNERDTFIDRIRLHQLIAGTLPATRVARPLTDLVHPRVRQETGRVVGVASGQVTLADGRTVRARHVLLATGSGPSGLPGSWDWAVQARGRLAALGPGARVGVLGAGLTGLEVASEIAWARKDLTVNLVDPVPVGAGYSPAGRQALQQSLGRLGVRLDAEPGAVDLTVDCTGFGYEQPGDLPDKQLDVDEYGRLRDLDRVWVAGDAARVAGQSHLRNSCASAEPMAALVVDQILRTELGRDLRPISIGYAGWCLSLGRRDGLIQFVSRDDRPTGRVWQGRSAAAAKEALCRFAVTAPVRWARWYRALNGAANG